MTEEQKNPTLFWEGGIFQCGIYSDQPLELEKASEAVCILQEFLLECQKLYFAFYSAIVGVDFQRGRYQRIFDSAHRDNRFTIGSAFPEAQQTPGNSTIAQMTQGELLQSVEEGGVFENYQAKSLIVMLFHLWDERYRPEIADALGVQQQQVECDLLGDVRLVRNIIIHKKSVVPDGFSDQVSFLAQIWDFHPGELRISSQMIHSFMEQLNAAKLRIVFPNA